MKKITLLVIVFLLAPRALLADDALVAVAANFSSTAGQLKSLFERNTNHRLTITSGSTGSLYAQIRNGAPYDILLAADQQRPALLLASGDAVAGSSFTFAVGRLVLWSANPALIRADLLTTLAQEDFAALAIANPALAPYGIASREALQSLGVWDSVRDRIVMGENVGQAMALVATGNAELGMLSLAQMSDGRTPAAAYLTVAEELHEPIRQDAVLLRHGRANVAAQEFLDFLKSAEGKAVIQTNGYGVD